MWISFFSSYLGDFWGFVFGKILQIGIIVGILFVFLAYVLLLDRKIWAATQKRRGPNVVGLFGLLQSFADFFKFALKEVIVPIRSKKVIFFLAPIISFSLSLSAWAVIPFDHNIVISNIDFGLLYIFAASSLATYGVILGGWASQSVYSLLGSVRSVAQMISYEIPIGFVFLCIASLSSSLNITDIVNSQSGTILSWNAFRWPLCFVLFPLMVLFFILVLAETARPPFDITEAESELVSGYHVEYSSTLYLLFMIAEYMNIALLSVVLCLLFLGGWYPIFSFLSFIPGFFHLIFKAIFIFVLISLVKALVPRTRYDQLMKFNWKFCIPFTLLCYVVIVFYMYFLV